MNTATEWTEMTSIPSLTVVTAVYNNRIFIADALRSILAQDYPRLEVVVVDGGSTDGTLKVLEGFQGSIANLVSEPDRGVYDALNKGIAKATGDVVSFLHSDDVYDSSSVVSSVMQHFQDPRTDAAYGDLVYVDRADAKRVIRTWRSSPFSRTDLYTGWMPPHPAFFMRRTRYHEWGAFDISFRIAGDYDALLRYLWTHRARCAYVGKTLVRMRMGGISNRSVSSLIRKSREDARALRKNGLPTFPAIVLKPLRKMCQYWKELV